MKNQIVEDIWQRRAKWSAAAGKQKASIEKWRYFVLVLAICGAFLATLSIQLPPEFGKKLVAWLSAAVLTIIPFFTTRKLSAQQTLTWTRLRSVSEALKSEIYMYLSQVAPYDGLAKDTVKILLENTKKLEKNASDLVSLLLLTPPLSSLPKFESPYDYFKLRLADQKNWYEAKAKVHMQKAKRLRKIELILMITAALLAAASGASGGALRIAGQDIMLGIWVAVLTTIGGTLTTHIAASRLDHLVTSYSATALQLHDFALDWSASDDDSKPSPEWSNFVRRCEDAISKENESWMAKWLYNEK